MGPSERRSGRLGDGAGSSWGMGFDSLSESSLLIPTAASEATTKGTTRAITGLTKERRRRNSLGARRSEALSSGAYS